MKSAPKVQKPVYRPEEHPYPSWRYHENGTSKIVKSAAEEPVGEEWSKTPWPTVAAPAAPVDEFDPFTPNQVLRAKILEMRTRFDTSWNDLTEKHSNLQEEHQILRQAHSKLVEEHSVLASDHSELAKAYAALPELLVPNGMVEGKAVDVEVKPKATRSKA